MRYCHDNLHSLKKEAFMLQTINKFISHLVQCITLFCNVTELYSFVKNTNTIPHFTIAGTFAFPFMSS